MEVYQLRGYEKDFSFKLHIKYTSNLVCFLKLETPLQFLPINTNYVLKNTNSLLN
jgi:hypothetical protein